MGGSVDGSNLEIERKWLVDREKIPYRLEDFESEHITQSYVSFSPVIRVRMIETAGDTAYVMTVKSKSPGKDTHMVRNEYETDISEKQYLSLLEKCEGHTLAKTRYKVPLGGGLVQEIDLFEDEFDGLAYMEIEFPDEAAGAAYVSPEWTEREVTEDKRFSNASLSRDGMPEL